MTETVNKEENKEEMVSQGYGQESDKEAKAEDLSDQDQAKSEKEEIEKVEEVEEKKEEEDFKKKFYYLAAEMENMKRRFSREKDGLVKFGNEKVLSSLLDVVDNLERTMSAIEAEEDEKIRNIAHGIKMVHDQFIDVLCKNGLSIVEAVGKQFDPKFHEAMAHQPAEGKNDDEIISEYQKGYILNGRLLRASKVIVVKN